MSNEHVISDELLEAAQIEFNKGNNWIAYNTLSYFLDTGEMYFFKESEEAHEFSTDNISDYDNYRIIYARSVDELLKRIPYGESLEQILENLKNVSIMNENNLKYLQDSLKYHGFGETLNPELEKQLTKGDTEFTLAHKTEVNKREIEATIYFKKSDTTDLYFFNKYDCKTKNESKGESVEQTFYINKGTGVTLKEAYNLLNGRAVHKELTDKQDQKYQAWIQLDFGAKDKNGNYERKQYHQNYGYDIKEALSYYPIKEMTKEDDMKTILRSLEKGNVQMVTLETPEKDMRVFIEANPQYKSVNVFSNKMERLDKDQREELMKKPDLNNDKGKEQANDKAKDQTQGLAGEDKDGKKLDKGGKKVKAGADDMEGKLLPKKRTNNQKSLGV